MEGGRETKAVPSLIYNSYFTLGFPGLRYLHPFDNYRARRAYAELASELGLPPEKSWGSRLPKPALVKGLNLVSPTAPARREDLSIVHTADYLESLNRSLVVASAIEVAPLALAPRSFLEWCLVRPMRWAVTGTLLAAREALRGGLAFSLAGGFHHAKPDRGEGFCIFNDIAYAIKTLRLEGLLKTVLYVDLDAHQGNGMSYVFLEDPSVKLFDMYNGEIYPYDEEESRARLDVSYPLEMGTGDREYLDLLEKELPVFLDAFADAEILFYNAGNDVVAGDRLGALNLSPEAVLQRDLYVIRETRRRGIPLVFLPSGGYTRESYRLITRSIVAAVRELVLVL